jgi:hypothetical protein
VSSDRNVPLSSPTLNVEPLRTFEPPITGHALRTASAVVAVPMEDGGIQIELHAGGVDLEIVVASTGAVKSVYWERVA